MESNRKPRQTPPGEVREGSEDKPRSTTNRKRSAKGASCTKAPMDGESGGCCNEKKGKGKCSACASGKPCGGKPKSRDDALTAPEYIAACNLGIQNRSRSYIRARLDSADRLDKKCGASGIAENKKCTKGGGSGGGLGNVLKAGLAVGLVGAGAVAYNNNMHDRRHQKAARQRTMKKIRDVKFKANAGITAAALAAKESVEFARESGKFSEEATIRNGMRNIKEAQARRTAAYSELRGAIQEFGRAVPTSPARKRKARRARGDSPYADGFALDPQSLAL